MDYGPILDAAGKQFNVDPMLAQAVLFHESGGDPSAVSPKGARGPMQLMPATARDMGVNPQDPTQNVTGGVRYLGQMLDKYGDVPTALAAYNAGPGNVDMHRGIPPFPETQKYVQNVMGTYTKLSGQRQQPQQQDDMPGLPPMGDVEAPGVDPFAGISAAPKAAAAPTGEVDPFAGLPAKGVAASAKAVAQPAPAAAPGFAGTTTSGAIQGLNDIQNGAAQWLYNALPQGVRNAGDAADHFLYQATGGRIGTAPGLNFNQAVQSQNNAYEQGRTANGRTGFDAMRMGGNTLGLLGLAATGMPATGVAGGVVAGALSPVTNGGANFWGDKAGDVLTGGLLGKATQVVGNTVGNVLAPKLSDYVRSLADAGVKLTPGQIFGGAAKRIEDAATSIPVLGDMLKDAQRRSFVDMNTAAFNRALEPIGEQLPSGMSGRNAVAYVAQKLGDTYDSILGRMGAIRPDAQFHTDLGSLTALTQNLPKSTADQFQSIVKNEIMARIDQNGVMTPQAMKAAEANLGKMAAGYSKDANYDTRQLGSAIQEAQATLRSMVQRVAPPQYAQALQQANAGWSNFLRAQRAASMTGSENGVFNPAQLQASVKALDPSRNKGAFARGEAPMQELSDAAKSVMGNTVPDSGTPMRHAVGAGVGALLGHSYLPESVTQAAIPVGLFGALGALPYTKTGQSITATLLTGQRPASMSYAGDLARRLLPWAAPALTGGRLDAVKNGG